MKTQFLNPAKIERKWLLIDAAGMPIGRLASRVALLLRGKNKPQWSPDVDAGDYVIVINAEKAILTGKKAETKGYFSASSRPGASKTTSYGDMMRKHPTYPVEHAVKGMLPKTILGDQMFKKLHVYAGAEHPHAAQKPEQVTL
ncbi:MAG: 50S ribosomal protein L13 [Fibrobacterales bacterium]|nr:50S ribosomal protein L13 [Fibrobacterales bacterium]MBP5188102.1 50S ribosomal protein L13 [Fibrobacterales bacterium]MBP5350622.1 50S ribosomal protein L13 [Fibrobacterales bacterium]MBQ7229004.1 50S ribosomal protein L13 [Clostridia bacterium]